MKFPSLSTHRQVLGMALIVIAVALLIYDFFSPPVGQLSNFALILFAKLIAIAGSLLNININTNTNSPKSPKDAKTRN